MDKEKSEKMAEMMKGCCADEGSISSCCSFMKKMVQSNEGKGAGERKKVAAEEE